ncbi:error-prone DNA polymerase [Saxibacter everestensis]|uniref:Error-prone DNA polymerase n=1 Tax=Saxibacter everestensis TaxID=2909229 RepID=A0ABY8QXH9_9MICO|nr:error-prone DNA polymerase [Brevibacteriaceae bacterium ZFBP1038]
MEFNNPRVPWSELARKLGDKPGRSTEARRTDARSTETRHTETGRPDTPAQRAVDGADGNDAPAWSRQREPYPERVRRSTPAATRGRTGRVAYAELHAHSNFSFLDGASHPEQLVEEAARLDLEAVALTDHDGFYGVVRFAQAARTLGMPTVIGSELSLGLPARPQGEKDPPGQHLLVLARGIEGYRLLSSAISKAQLAGGEKGRPVYHIEDLAASANDQWMVLTGCRKGTLHRALAEGNGDAELRKLIDLFGHENVAVELTHHGFPDDDERLDRLAALARAAHLPVVATNAVHYATRKQAPLASALAAVRARGSLDDLAGWMPPAGIRHLRSGSQMARIFERFPLAVPTAVALARECAFELHLAEPRLPPYPVPEGHTLGSWLRHLTYEGAEKRYGSRSSPQAHAAWQQIDQELATIDRMGFPGYFLIVWDIARFCRDNNIFCQGRGSAANSAVCYVLGITAVDAVYFHLLFDRFLAPDRDGYPDIDLDIESGRREEAIQYVYNRYGREYAAQVANVISYRPRSAIRDMAKALGHDPGQQDAWAKQVDRWRSMPDQSSEAEQAHDIPRPVMKLAGQILDFPRHLGIHSGGMVLCDRPVAEVCPVEWGRMPGRTVLQWDKDDCADMKLVKFDLLGLGMLSALHQMTDLVAEHHGREIDRATIPPDDPRVYDMLCRADAIGVFQVESRAQLATLPRLQPRTFYDLAIEVALIRPGPIQGGSVHPYIRRKQNKEPVTYLHPLLEKSLTKTLGVPLFQEQLMQMAIDVAGFSGADADELRRAMGNKRSIERMERLRARFFSGMAERGITGETAEQIYDKMEAFANFGFPESHSISFANLVYQSAWMKLYFPAAFCVGLLRSQPMGFYSPQSLVADARRHGIEIRGVDINASRRQGDLERLPGHPAAGTHAAGTPAVGTPGAGMPGADTHAAGAPTAGAGTPGAGYPPAGTPVASTDGYPDVPVNSHAIRIGLDSVRTIGAELAAEIDSERERNGMFRDIPDLCRRVTISQASLEALATAGAFDSLGLQRREALWIAGAMAGESAETLPGTHRLATAPALPVMSDFETSLADLWATGITPEGYPTRHLRQLLDARGVLSTADLLSVSDGRRVLVGGLVTHRQRPATASGITFINLEDESGMVNVVCSPGLWARYRQVAMQANAMLVHGRVQRADTVVSVTAEKLETLPIARKVRSRDFQ